MNFYSAKKRKTFIEMVLFTFYFFNKITHKLMIEELI